MAELKTKATNQNPVEFLHTIEPEQKQKDGFALLEMFQKITEEKAVMWGTSIVGFGKYHYKSERSSQEGDWPLVGFSPRKQNLTLYIMSGNEGSTDLLDRLGKHKKSVGCLYINNLSDVDQSILGKLIKKSFQYMKTQNKTSTDTGTSQRVSNVNTKKELSNDQRKELLEVLKSRFENNMSRHKEITWTKVLSKLEANTQKLWSLNEMERTGGEPDVIGYDKKSDEYIFYDCSSESPSGRLSLCYDRDALESRKEHKPVGSAIGMSEDMGVELLNEAQYRELQKLEKFDTRTSSWVLTPTAIRKLGGALFCDRRYDHVFTYHNGVESYYASRGFRAVLRV